MREVHAYKRYWAMGSGFPYALGAMWARYDDLDAVDLATVGVEAGVAFDRSSAGPVLAYEVPLAPLGPRSGRGRPGEPPEA